MKIERLLAIDVVIEDVMSLALAIDPRLVSRLLFGVDLSPGGIAIARLTAIALFSLGLACWPDKAQAGTSKTSALRGMLSYNLIATIYLVYLWLVPHLVGLLLIPALFVHIFFTLVFAKNWFQDQRSEA